jgi:hypothetical protein
MTGITEAKPTFEIDRRRLIKLGLKLLNERFSHTAICRIIVACFMIDTAS